MRSLSREKKVQPGQEDKIYRDFPQVAIQLTREAEAARHAAHGRADGVVQVAVGRGRELKGAEACVVERSWSSKSLLRVLYELMEREHGILGFHHPKSGTAEIPDGNRRVLPLCARRPARNRPALLFLFRPRELFNTSFAVFGTL